MTIDIEEEVAELRKSKSEDDLFYKVIEYEKGYIREIDNAERENNKEAIKEGIDSLLSFYTGALEVATSRITRRRIIAWIRVWKAHAYSKDIKIEPVTNFPSPIYPLNTSTERTGSKVLEKYTSKKMFNEKYSPKELF